MRAIACNNSGTHRSLVAPHQYVWVGYKTRSFVISSQLIASYNDIVKDEVVELEK